MVLLMGCLFLGLGAAGVKHLSGGKKDTNKKTLVSESVPGIQVCACSVFFPGPEGPGRAINGFLGSGGVKTIEYHPNPGSGNCFVALFRASGQLSSGAQL